MALDLTRTVAVRHRRGQWDRPSDSSRARQWGANVVVTDLDEDRANTVAADIGDAAVAVSLRCDERR